MISNTVNITTLNVSQMHHDKATEKIYSPVKYSHKLFLNELIIINVMIFFFFFLLLPLPNPVTLSWDKSDSTHSPLCYNRSCHFQHAPVAFLASRLCPSPTAISPPGPILQQNATRRMRTLRDTMQISLRHRLSHNWHVAKHFGDGYANEALGREMYTSNSSKLRRRAHKGRLNSTTAPFLRESSYRPQHSSGKDDVKSPWLLAPSDPFRSKIHTFLTHHRTLHTPPTNA